MIHLIGKLSRSGNTEFVSDLKEVSEDFFQENLQKACRKFGGSDEMTNIALYVVRKKLSDGKPVMIEGQYFTLTKPHKKPHYDAKSKQSVNL